MKADTIKVSGISKRFDSIIAVNAVSFSVGEGECFGLLGPNGAGKSTTIKMLTTLLQPDEGEITIDSYSIRRHPSRIRSIIGYVPQAVSADGTLTGYENLLMYAKIYGLSRRIRSERIRSVLSMLELEAAAGRQVKAYSGGMIRRLEIGQAILHRPKVLFLDEPTVGLDPVSRKNVWAYIEALRKEWKMTVVLTTHYMDEAESMCSRVAIMSKGEIAVQGTVSELREKMDHREASMDEIFAHFAGAFEQQEGGMKDVLRHRRTARRLG